MRNTTFANTGKRTFKSFELWKMFPGNAPAIIAHYKKLLAGLNYEGEWKGDGQESAWGEFTRGRHRLNLSINEEKFSFNLRVFD